LYGLFCAVVLGASVLTTAGSMTFSRLSVRSQSWAAAAVVLFYAVLLLLRPDGLASSNVAVLSVSIAVGTRIGRGLASRGALLAFAVTASIIDIVSFTAGPTRWLLGRGSGSAREGIRYLAVSLPVSGRDVPIVGVGDLLILAVLFTGLRGLRMPTFSSAAVLCAGLLAALAVGLVAGGAFGIPFMAGAAGFYLWVVSRSRNEWDPTVKAG
jgi:hypothetical protein